MRATGLQHLLNFLVGGAAMLPCKFDTLCKP